MKTDMRGEITKIMAEHPSASKAALGRLLYKKFPSRFKDTEAARSKIRTYTGANGKFLRGVVGDTLFDSAGLAKKYGIPEAVPTTFEPFILRAENALLIADVHIPFHDPGVLAKAIEYGEKAGCETLILNGDIMDCHHLSTFRKDAPVRMRFEDEVAAVKSFFITMAKQFKQIVFKYGNHEERFQHFLQVKAEELYGLAAFELSHILDLYNLGIRWVTDKRPMRLDHLTIIHGHEYAGGFVAPVNTARGLFLKAKSIALQGHTHQTSEHTENTIDDRIITTWSVGCLCNLHPKYMPLNKWNHGFAIIRQDKAGKFRVENKRIIKGEVY